MEIMLECRATTNFPPEVTLPRRDSMIADFAEDVALRERDRLALGLQPIPNLRQMLETDVGVRIFCGLMPSTIAGMYAFVAELGYCVLVNRKHPIERQRATLAHEYGHFLCDRHRPGFDYLERPGRKPANERFAEAFGLSFLMPAAGIRRQFHEITATTGDFQVSDLCRLSSLYAVSVQALTLRLEDLGLIDRGTWNMLQDKGFRPRQTARDLGLKPRHAEGNEVYPERYKYLAVKAYEIGKISEGQLCKFLRCDPVTARGIVAECSGQSYVDASGEIRFGRMPLEHSLLSTPR